jgi:hypothetical protein
MTLPKFCAGLLLFAALAAPLHAGTIIADDKSKKVACDDFPYTKGSFELEIDGGAFGSISTHGTPVRPDMGYAIGAIRGGLMLSTPASTGILRGNFEVLAEVFGGGIFSGPGDELVGLDLYFRYNFVQPCAKIVPFIQVGGGGVYSDAAHDDPIQRNIGSDFSFVLEAEIGVRYHIRKNLAITTGFEYRHISNAGTADRNVGLNALGGLIGISWFF